jgi:hypothetical protein
MAKTSFPKAGIHCSKMGKLKIHMDSRLRGNDEIESRNYIFFKKPKNND